MAKRTLGSVVKEASAKARMAQRELAADVGIKARHVAYIWAVVLLVCLWQLHPFRLYQSTEGNAPQTQNPTAASTVQQLLPPPDSPTPVSAPEPEPSSSAPSVESSVPDSEKHFCDAFGSAEQQFETATEGANEFKTQREEAKSQVELMRAVGWKMESDRNTKVINWIGTLKSLKMVQSTDWGELGEVEVEIPCRVTVGAWETEGSIMAGVKSFDAVYKQLADLQEGQTVYFNGSFLPLFSGSFDLELPYSHWLKAHRFVFSFSALSTSPIATVPRKAKQKNKFGSGRRE